MSWFSILPANLTIVETWIIRFFVSPPCLAPSISAHAPQLLLGIITIGPWAILIVYDILLYLVRAIAYEIPYFGGRARGRRRPRAPSLAERPNGRRRTFSISGAISGSEGVTSGTSGSEGDEKEGLRKRWSEGDGLDNDRAIYEEPEDEGEGRR